MPSTVFRRPARRPAPVVPSGEVLLQPPPETPTADLRGTWLTALPALSGLGSVAYIFAGPGNPVTYVAGSFFLFSSLAMVAGSLLQARAGTRADAHRSRRDYLRYLGRVRRQVRQAAAAQRAAAEWSGPAPDQLWSVAASPRLWERRAGDADCGVVRLGLGAQHLATRLVPGESGPVDDLDPLAAVSLKRFLTTHAVVPDLPVLLALRRFAAVRLSGERAACRGLARAVVAQAVTAHAPDTLLVAVCTRDPDGEAWSWAKWLPHAQHPAATDATGPLRLIDPSLAVLERELDEQLTRRARFSRTAEPEPDLPHLLVVLDGGTCTGLELLLDPDGLASVTVLDLDGPAEELVARHGVELVLDGRELAVRAGDGLEPLGRADDLAVPVAESLARQLAGSRLDVGSAQAEDLATVDQTLPGLLGIDDPAAADLGELWRPRPLKDRLRVPIGIAADGTVLELDVKESAQDGVGPHGLVVGATGSGKSELLRTLVMALVATHPPEQLNLVLVDFKGGATFAGTAELPHVSAVITNLEDDLGLVDRMREALSGEINRRQELLRAAGHASARDHETARLRGAPLPPLPSLLVVVDEFSEMLAQKPDFAELFVQIGRVGRSLGLHLLLASQKLDEGRVRGLETHLSYRIGLRTFSAQESRAVLGVPDAHELPAAPGHGFLRSDSATLTRFRAAYVSGPYRSADGGAGPGGGGLVDVLPFRAGRSDASAPTPAVRVARHAVDPAARRAEPAAPPPVEVTVLDVLVRRMSGQGTPAHRVWLPPLDDPEPLDALLPGLDVRPGRGFGVAPGPAPLAVPIGLVDRPFHQRRDQLVVDLAGAGGHVAVVGGPHSGKSTLLRTLVAALALRHTPAEVQVYALDFSGTLFGLAGLPHVGGVAGRRDAETARAVVAQVAAVVEDREARFRELGVDTMADYRRLPAADRVDDPYGDVFLVVDGWSVLRADFEDLEARITSLAGRSLNYGVHVVLAASRWLDLRFGLRDLVGTKLELKLGDALDSEVDRKAQAAVPAGRPGRGISPAKLHYLAALPRVDGRRSADDLAAGVAHLVAAVAGGWTGPPAPRVGLLPTSVALDELPADALRRGTVIGVGGDRVEPLVLDPRADTGLVLLGDGESGKTAALRAVARQVVARCTPEQAKVVVFDPRRTLLGEVPESHRLGYAATAQDVVDGVGGLLDGFRKRVPGRDVTPAQLRDRSWWTGPDVYLLVDDYDLVATTSGNPLAPLADLLPQARDIGLHLYVARRAAGAGRALMDPVVGRMRELGWPAVVLSAPKDEGQIFGVRGGPKPPGRGTLVHRRLGTVPIQLVRAEPQEW